MRIFSECLVLCGYRSESWHSLDSWGTQKRELSAGLGMGVGTLILRWLWCKLLIGRHLPRSSDFGLGMWVGMYTLHGGSRRWYSRVAGVPWMAPTENPGWREERTHVSPGGSNCRTPGLGHWRLCSCSSHRPWPALSAGRGSGIRLRHKPQPRLLVSSRGHLPGARSLQALGSLKLQGQVKDMRPRECTVLWGRRGAGPEGEACSGLRCPPAK